jgi:hypothetical protein
MISPYSIFEVNKLLHVPSSDKIFWLLSIFCQFFKLSIWISCFRVLFGCNSTFEHPAYLTSGKKWCGSIFLYWQKMLSSQNIFSEIT